MLNTNTFASLITWLLALMLSVAGAILILRCLCEPFAPGISFRRMLRRLLERHRLDEGLADSSGEESSWGISRGLRRRLRHNKWALHNQWRLLLWIGCVMLLSRLLILAAAMVGSCLTDSLSKLFTAAISHWVRWDASSYIDLAHYGYSANQPELLAYLPLYPLLVRLVSILCFGHYVFAGFLVSNTSLMLAGFTLYHMVNDEYGERTARRAVMLLMFAPLSLVFSVPYAESLLLMLTLTSVYSARNRHFLAAGALGALAACTQLIGALVFVPVVMEMLKYLRALNLRRRNARRFWLLALSLSGSALLIFAGTGVYLLINHVISRNAFEFINVLKVHMNQEFGTVLSTQRYSVQLAFTYGDMGWQLGTWIPQAVAILMSALIILLVCTAIEPGDGLYAWLYLILVMSPSWLLSGLRAVTALYPLYIALAFMCRKKWTYVAIMVASIALMCLFSYYYALLGTVV
ncbi:MAG: hypothetical protein IJJ23_02755 [Clostridia bacterium]|nr:hypothetical protein [Clostridia bacterium]